MGVMALFQRHRPICMYAGLGGSVRCAVRLETRRSQVQLVDAVQMSTHNIGFDKETQEKKSKT